MNDKNKEFLTPLHCSVDKSHYDVIDVLLKLRSKVNALDSAGQTALHRGARDGNVQACRILLSAGADPSIVSLQGFTAAQLSTESVSKLLSEEPSAQVCIFVGPFCAVYREKCKIPLRCVEPLILY